MLQNMRDNLKGIGIVIVVIISIPFVLTGAEQFFVDGGTEPVVAEVNGVTITSADVLREMGPQAAQYEDSYKDLLQQMALSNIVSRVVLQSAAEENGMTVANETLEQRIRAFPDFHRDGAFDPDMYRRVLDLIRHTPQSFARDQKRQLLIGQFASGVAASEFVSEAELAQSVAVEEQLRDFYYLTVPVAPLLETVEIGEDALTARYEETKEQLLVPEQVVVEYVELTQDSLTSSLEVDEAEVRERFEEELEDARNSNKQQRRVAHILISDGGERQPQEVATEIKAKLDAGEDFSKMAEAHSQDSATANAGGELDLDPSLLPEPLAEAALALGLNEVSEPIQTDSGYHLLKVIDIQQASLPTFEGQKQRIIDAIKNEAAEEQYAIVLKKMNDAAFGIFPEDSLQKVADELGLQMQLSEPFSRSGGAGVAAEQAVITAAFSKEVLDEGYSSKVQELSGGRAVVVKLQERIPERTKELAEVREDLLADLKLEKAKELVKTRGEELLARVVAGESVEAVAKAEQLEWQVSLDTKRAGGNVDTTARSKAFALTAPTADQPQAEGSISSNGDYILVHLTSVEYPSVDKLPQDQRQTLAASLKEVSARRSLSAYQRLLMQQADTK